MSIIIVRKYFHGWCLVLFLPIIRYDAIYLSLSFSIALWLFINIEASRVCNFAFLSAHIERYCRPFLDERDAGRLVLTHVWLLIGCATPLWYSFIINYDEEDGGGTRAYNDMMRTLYGVSGIIVLGIGDAMAAVIGSTFGRVKWPNSSKTFEGSLAAIVSCLLLYTVMFPSILYDNVLLFKLAQVITATFVVEALQKQIDNLYLPLFCCLLMDVTFVS